MLHARSTFFSLSPARRRVLLGMLGVPLLLVGACNSKVSARDLVSVTFLQLWPEHARWTAEAWDQYFGLLKTLGYREVIVQWTAKEGGKSDWRLPDDALDKLFDAAEIHGFGVQVGLPHDDRWTEVLNSPDIERASAFFDMTSQTVRRYVDESSCPQRNGFRGWYIPYEIEQYSWSDISRRMHLTQWLADLAATLEIKSGSVPTISTYFSQLESTLTLEQLWSEILDATMVRPMIQDGVGVAGLENYRNLEPLRALFVQRRLKWDLIIELFEELPSEKTDGTTFHAQSAAFSRVSRQLKIASDYGAASIVAFSADPWLIGSGRRAKALLQHWQQS